MSIIPESNKNDNFNDNVIYQHQGNMSNELLFTTLLVKVLLDLVLSNQDMKNCYSPHSW